MSILAGAASVLALAGGALLELGDWRDPIEVAPQVTQVRPKETPMALAAAATSVPAVEWTLQRTVDVALMKAAPDAVRPTPVPPPRAIQTANKAVPVTGDKPVLPERRGSAPETVQFVAKPYVPNVAPTPARVPAAQAAVPIPAVPVAAAAHAGDPRPDDLFQHGRDNRNGTVSSRTVNNRGASGGKPAAATGTGSAVDARSASARSGTAASGASADPRGEGSGGARVGVDSDAGAPSDASSGDASEGTSDAADAGDGGANGDGSSAGAADGGDTAGTGAGDGGAGDGGTGDTGAGSGDTGGASAGDGGTGDTNAGGGDTGGDESGDASEGGSGDGDSDAGESGAIGGAVGGALDAVGDALGDGKGNPDSNDKDQRN